MNKCDKCGCEHGSRDVCPKCGAPVVLVNEDYLRRKMEWEQRMKAGETLVKANPEPSNSDAFKKKKLDFSTILKKLRSVKLPKVEIDRNKIKKVLVSIAVIALLVAVVFLVMRLLTPDKDDLVYFDGHQLISVNDGVLYSADDFSDTEFMGADTRLKSLFVKADGRFYGWHGGELFPMDCEGSPNYSYMFSENGRYLAFVTCVESDDVQTYYVNIADFEAQGFVSHEMPGMTEVMHLYDDGRIVLLVMSVMNHSVVSTDVYMADGAQTYLLCSDVSSSLCGRDGVLCLADERLYLFQEGKSALLVAENVQSVVRSDVGDCIFYIDDTGLWEYEQIKGESTLLTMTSEADVVYKVDGKVYYRDGDSLYECKGNIPERLLEKITGEIITCKVSDNNTIMLCLSDRKLYSVGDGVSVMADNIDCFGTAKSGVSAIMDGKLVLIPFKNTGKIRILSENNVKGSNFTEVYFCGKFIYFRDKSSVLWKMSKDGSEREPLGYASLVAYLE